MNNRKNRQDEIRTASKHIKGCTNVPSFEAGAKWADYHPYWREDMPEPSFNERDGLPKLYLCQILTLDMTFGFRHSYRIGFVTPEGKWNIDQYSKMTKVIRWMNIYGLESESQLLEDIQNNEKYFLDDVIKKDEEVA